MDQESSYEALRNQVDGIGVVIPGFYGQLPDGKIKTFTRGGSDITGALAAAALDADVYENWTDVSGFLFADPHVVDNPQVMKTVTYRELRELSYMGATVIHEDAIFPVMQKKIPIRRPEKKRTEKKRQRGSGQHSPTSTARRSPRARRVTVSIPSMIPTRMEPAICWSSAAKVQWLVMHKEMKADPG